jgi:predicted esterase
MAEPLTADYKKIKPLKCHSCGADGVIFKYARFSDMCICTSCDKNVDASKYLKGEIREFEFKNLTGLSYVTGQNNKLLVIFSGYDCAPKRTFKSSRYGKWADYYGYNLLVLSDAKLYWDATYHNNINTIVSLLTKTPFYQKYQYKFSDISFLGFSNGGIQMAAVAVSIPVKQVIFVSAFVPLAANIVVNNKQNYLSLNPISTIIVDNLKDEGFTNANKSISKFLTQSNIKHTNIELATGHNMRACGGKLFEMLCGVKQSNAFSLF